jgi:hypothetical protein
MRQPTLRLLPLLVLASLLWITPISAQQPTDNGCLPPLGLAPGQQVTIIGGVYIRALPDLDSGIVAYSPDRIAATVLDGPVCADGFNWWQVERVFNEPTFKGWVAQQLPNKLFVIPNQPEDLPPPCPPALDVPLNTAVATYDGIRVREAPSTDARVLTVAQPNTTALVLAGPTCNQGFNWWRVRVEVVGVAYTGWIVEGIPATLADDPQNPITDTALLNPLPDAGPNSQACGPAMPLETGAVGVLRFSGPPLKNLRVSPSTASNVLYTLPSGIKLSILSGPFCNEGVNWREVRVQGGSVQPQGWIAEGTWLGRFSGPSGEDYGQPAP